MSKKVLCQWLVGEIAIKESALGPDHELLYYNIVCMNCSRNFKHELINWSSKLSCTWSGSGPKLVNMEQKVIPKTYLHLLQLHGTDENLFWSSSCPVLFQTLSHTSFIPSYPVLGLPPNKASEKGQRQTPYISIPLAIL